MKIIKIGKTTDKKTEICFDDRPSVIARRRDAAAMKLFVGQELTEEAWQETYREGVLSGAKARALDLLKVRDRSEREIGERLIRDGYEGDVAKEVTDWLKDCHYLDDEQFADDYIRWRGEGKSRREIVYKLRQKGIDISCFDREWELPDDRATIRQLLEKRFSGREDIDEKERNRAIAWLARKGFVPSDIFAVLRELGN